MDYSAVFERKVYVIHVKVTINKDTPVWDASDIIYGIAHEGKGGLSFTAFKHICEKNNQKCFLSKKANVKNYSSCTWGEICSALDEWPCVGNPKLVLCEKPETFYEVARLAYELLIFTDKDGLDKLNMIAAQQSSSKSEPSSLLDGALDSAKCMIQKTMAAAKALSANREKINTDDLSQGVLSLPYWWCWC